VKTLRSLWLLLLFGQFLFAQSTFTKPSEAYEFARRPLTEWEAALHAHEQPATRLAPNREVWHRFKAFCPSFTLESVSGEELYWLAKLCEQDHAKALLAVERYLSGGNEVAHGPDARLLLATLQMRTTGSWEAAWGTIQTILRDDPIQPVESQIDGVIDDEADTDPQEALEWSKERYALLLDRSPAEKPGVPPVSAGCVLSAGSDLVHRYYMAGQTGQAVKLLDEMNRFANSRPDAAMGWGLEDLHWANLEMQPAPPLTVLKMLGRNPLSDLIQPGRVEMISFFFLGCSPCIQELPDLNALQKRYGRKKLLVTDVTTYKVNWYPTSFTDSQIEGSLEKVRLEKAPRIGVVITSDETLAIYGIHGFPVVALVDKLGRLRYFGRDLNFKENDSVGRLIQTLIEE
jgi:thiol-disulfide isomerase/thioredoxin